MVKRKVLQVVESDLKKDIGVYIESCQTLSKYIDERCSKATSFSAFAQECCRGGGPEHPKKPKPGYRLFVAGICNTDLGNTVD